MSSDNICELFLVRRLHFHTNAAPQKCRRKLTLLITGEYDKRESRTAYVSCFNNNWLILISTAIEHNSCLPGLLSHPSQLWNVVLPLDRKSTRLNSSHVRISYAVFCLKKKN